MQKQYNNNVTDGTNLLNIYRKHSENFKIHLIYNITLSENASCAHLLWSCTDFPLSQAIIIVKTVYSPENAYSWLLFKNKNNCLEDWECFMINSNSIFHFLFSYETVQMFLLSRIKKTKIQFREWKHKNGKEELSEKV